MTTERATMLVTLVTIFAQGGIYLLGGGFAVGGQLSNFNAELKLLRRDVMSANQIQDYRLDKLEASINK